MVLKLLKLYEKKFKSAENFKNKNPNNSNNPNNEMNLLEQKVKSLNLFKTDLPVIRRNVQNSFNGAGDTYRESEQKSFNTAKFQSSMKALNSVMFGNLYIVYKNNKSKSLFS